MLSSKQKLLFFQVFLLLLYYSFLIQCFSFKRYCHILGNENTSKINNQYDQVFAEQVVKYILLTSKYMPIQIKCFAQALVAKKILKRKKIHSTLFLGIQKNGDILEAHAWLEINGHVVLGIMKKSTFIPVKIFG
ncbi:lasso peptide biosynthesis B2 protein [Bacteroidota bacterium]